MKANYDAGLYTTVIDIEENWYLKNRGNVPPHIFKLIEYARKRSKQLHTNFELYERVQNLINDKETKKKNKLLK